MDDVHKPYATQSQFEIAPQTFLKYLSTMLLLFQIIFHKKNVSKLNSNTLLLSTASLLLALRFSS